MNRDLTKSISIYDLPFAGFPEFIININYYSNYSLTTFYYDFRPNSFDYWDGQIEEFLEETSMIISNISKEGIA